MKTSLRLGKFLAAVQILVVLTWALQTKAQTSSFVSAEDQELHLKTVTAVPFTDNVKGIYAAPLFQKFTELLSNDDQWTYQALPNQKSSTDLEEQPSQVQALAASAKADGLFTFHMTKGPRGVNARLTLYTAQSGWPLLQEELHDYPGFETKDLEKQVEDLYLKIKARLPYRGFIVSRRGQEVTINLGTKAGIRAGDELSVIQVLKINRHPKLHFMVGTDKEILGRIKVYKADEALSFAYVSFEKEPGVVTLNSKLLSKDFVHYQDLVTENGKVIPGLGNRADRDLSYGESPSEWLPETAPQYGRIALLAGFGSYSESVNLSTQPIEANTTLAPSIALRGEIWLNPEWNILYQISQSVFSVSNPLPGSSPGQLNLSLSSYSVRGAYNFLMNNDFFGPKIQLSFGYASYNSRSDQSVPLTFTDMNYSGLVFGIFGEVPLSTEVPFDLGAGFNYYLNPGLSESVSSGSSNNTINEFNFFGVYHLRRRFNIRGEINFQYYSSDFSGTGSRSVPATNSTQKMTSFLGGVEFLF